MITVYLSSTFRDLKGYRRQVLDYFAALKDRYRVVNMEDYTAEDKLVYKKCMADVRDCQLYILLLGKSYGSVAYDPEDPVFNVAEGFSYTHYEYLQARANQAEGRQTTILIFQAVPETELPENDPDGKLAAFIKNEVAGRLGGMYSSPVDLEIQLNRALANLFFKVPAFDARSVYKIDRGLQSNVYNMKVSKLQAPLRSILLYGREHALCGNFVQRLSLFKLSLDELKQNISFDEFIADDYETSLYVFLNRVYEILLPDRSASDVATLLQDIQSRPGRSAIVMECLAAHLEEAQADFLRRFMAECAQLQLPSDAKPLYFFFKLVEREADPEKLAEQQIEKLREGTDPGAQFNVPLPRLGLVKWLDLKAWMVAEITPNDGTVLEILNDYFPGFPDEGITMEAANRTLTDFVADLNARDPKTAAYNLY